MRIDKGDLNFKAIEIRERFGEDCYSPINIFGLVKQISELTIVLTPLSDTISGMCIKTEQKGIAVIAINSNMTYGRKRFTLAHELYHYCYSEETKTICGIDLQTTDDDELKANIFASYLLMPDHSLKMFIKDKCDNKINIDSILKIENHYEISRSALLVRLLRDGLILQEDYDNYKKDVLKNARTRGYSLDLYSKNTNTDSRTVGKYIVLANNLLESGALSVSKYKKIMLDAFRDDLIYPDTEVGDDYNACD